MFRVVQGGPNGAKTYTPGIMKLWVCWNLGSLLTQLAREVVGSL
jgi:hypothetical protein